jgi:ubiquinone/menaquinone biosynthesis C-methylase UbiE
MSAIDISENFISFALEAEKNKPLGIAYHVASAVSVPFANDAFDFVTAFMSLMDIPETELVFAEVWRVLKPGGFFQFSITHPCFTTPHRRNLRNPSGQTYAVEVGNYFDPLDGTITEWLFGETPPEVKRGLEKFKTPLFTKTLARWLNLLIGAGFTIKAITEPRPSDATVQACPAIQDAQIVAYFLHVRARKSA